MGRPTEQYRRIAHRLLVESLRLERVAESLLAADLPVEASQARGLAAAAHLMHTSLDDLADSTRCTRGARRVNTSSGESRG